VSTGIEQSQWLELPIICPNCGNHGEPDGQWEANAWTPFKLIEEVVRSWEFAAEAAGDSVTLTADSESDSVDWESGTNLRVECMQCFEAFPLPENPSVSFV
jgi:hypothetical protein